MKCCQRLGLGFIVAGALAVQATATAYTCRAVQYQDVIPEASIERANYPSGVNDRGDTVGTYQVCNNGLCVEHGVLRYADGTIVSIQYPKSYRHANRRPPGEQQFSVEPASRASLRHG